MQNLAYLTDSSTLVPSHNF